MPAFSCASVRIFCFSHCQFGWQNSVLLFKFIPIIRNNKNSSVIQSFFFFSELSVYYVEHIFRSLFLLYLLLILKCSIIK